MDDGALESDFDGVLERLNALLEREHLVHAYLAAEVSVDSRNAVAQARLSRLMQEAVGLSNLQTRITAWLGTWTRTTSSRAPSRRASTNTRSGGRRSRRST